MKKDHIMYEKPTVIGFSGSVRSNYKSIKDLELMIKDSENITSPIISKDSRNGHTIDISLKINSWVNIEWLNSPSHDIEIKKINNKQAEITLKNKNEIPNKDFIFTYKVASDIPQIGILTHKDKNSDHGYFTLIAEPQVAPKKEEIRNKEIVFVLDTSWSMSGMPIIALRKAMIKAIQMAEEGFE